MSYQPLIMLSIFGWGVGSFFYKLANDRMHPLMVTTMVTILYVLTTPLAFALLKFDRSINGGGVLYAVIGGAFTCVGSLAYFYAMNRGAGGGEATTLTALYPALTLVLSCLFLGEPFSLRKGIGVTFALVSFFILSHK